MKQKISTILATIVLIVGICCVAYPFASNLLAQHERNKVSNEYEQFVEQVSEEDLTAEKEAALRYNEGLRNGRVRVVDPFNPDAVAVDDDEYSNVMNIAGDSIMGNVYIPSIGIRTPIYHGTSDEVLEKGAGHISATSLPFGGDNSHCVLAGHTGLPNVKVFDALDKLKVGNLFYLDVLGEMHAYRIYDIEVVLPDNTDSLIIEDGRDLCTLVTCTPYGINSHRLLVHGERCPLPDPMEREPGVLESTVRSMNSLELKVLALAIALIILMIIVLIIRHFAKKRRRKRELAERRAAEQAAQQIGLTYGPSRFELEYTLPSMGITPDLPPDVLAGVAAGVAMPPAGPLTRKQKKQAKKQAKREAELQKEEEKRQRKEQKRQGKPKRRGKAGKAGKAAVQSEIDSLASISELSNAGAASGAYYASRAAAMAAADRSDDALSPAQTVEFPCIELDNAESGVSAAEVRSASAGNPHLDRASLPGFDVDDRLFGNGSKRPYE